MSCPFLSFCLTLLTRQLSLTIPVDNTSSPPSLLAGRRKRRHFPYAARSTVCLYRSMLMTHPTSQSDWRQQTQSQRMSNQMPWQLDAGVSLFPMSGEQVNHAHLGRLQEDWLARAQPSSLRRPSTDNSSSDPSKHSTHEALTLKEKNRRAQRKFREKQKVSFFDKLAFVQLTPCAFPARPDFLAL